MKKHICKKTVSFIAAVLALIFILPSCAPADSIIQSENNNPKSASKLPEMHITTQYNEEITSKTNYSNITIRFALNDELSQYSNTYTDIDGGAAELRCRGNSTYGKADLQAKNKYSYKLRLESKVDLLGLGESRHWYLLANWFDVTHMRNKLAYDFSGALGMTYTKSTWVVMYYNGEYRGIYSLVESIRIEEGRIDTFNWEEYAEDIAHLYEIDNNVPPYAADQLTEAMKNDLSWLTTKQLSFTFVNPDTYEVKTVGIDLSNYFDPSELDFTSGYLIEYDNRLHDDGTKWRTNKKIPVVMDNPAALSTNEYMFDYVQTLIQDFEDALYSPTFYNSKGYHYSEYLDVDSLVNFWTVWNLFNNIEFGVLSLYYYIDDGKIVFGPCWDFDNATGNIVTLNEKWEKWDYWVEDRGNSSNGWFSQIMGDPYFVALCQEKWYSIRPLINDMMRSLSVYHDYLEAEAVRCYERNGPRVNWYLKTRNDGKSYDFETDYKLLCDWLKNRINWIESNLSPADVRIDNSDFTRGEKLKIVSTNSNLKAPNKNMNGVMPDYVFSSSTNNTLSLSITTTSTSANEISVYLNGKLILNSAFTKAKGVKLELDPSDLKTYDQALNVLYILEHKKDGSIREMSSVIIKAVK